MPTMSITIKCCISGLLQASPPRATRCDESGCDNGAQGQSGLCIAHGGGRSCEEPGCDKTAKNGFKTCAAHGGGKHCDVEGC